jgi:putative endonuclease
LNALSSHARGRAAELRACDFLERRGLVVLARNFRCRQGEIDLVLRDGATVVVAEIRYRADNSFGTPAETVDGRKQMKLIACARRFLQAHPALALAPLRFDVVAVAGGDSRIDWIRDAFRA